MAAWNIVLFSEIKVTLIGSIMYEKMCTYVYVCACVCVYVCVRVGARVRVCARVCANCMVRLLTIFAIGPCYYMAIQTVCETTASVCACIHVN